MRKARVTKRKSIDFSRGVRGKYADMKLVIVGAASNNKEKAAEAEANAEAVLRKVYSVLDSAGPSKRDLVLAINRARDLIESVRHP
jgi:hypothetical protein